LCALKKIRIKFSKTGDSRFLSHLDLVRLFQRASRRAGLPVSITKGFNPHLKISINRALKLGVASSEEEAVFHMDMPLDTDRFMASMNGTLPDGVRLKSAEEIA